ncbi:MAG: hypothetical protein U0414_08025 [Polyangiaceae bacterium]
MLHSSRFFRAALAALVAFIPATALAQPQPQPQPQPPQPPPLQPVPQPPLVLQPSPQPQPPPQQPGQQVIVSGQPGATTIYSGGTQVVIQGPQPNMEWVRPDKLTYVPGEVIPNGYVDRELTNTGLLIGGISTFGAIYFPTLVSGLTLADGDPGFAALAAPVIGPLIGIGTIRGVEGPGAYLLVLDFIAQSTGVVLFSASFASHPHVLRRVGEAAPPTVQFGARPGGASMTLSF